jgi:hypothetical protein
MLVADAERHWPKLRMFLTPLPAEAGADPATQQTVPARPPARPPAATPLPRWLSPGFGHLVASEIEEPPTLVNLA